MNRQWLRQALQTMGGTFQTTLKRFPVTVVFVLALTLYLFHLILIEAKGDEKLFWVTGYYLSTGTLLSLTLHLWCEEVKRNSRKWMIQITMHALLIADTWFLYSLSPERSLTEIGIAHAAALFALGLSVFFLSFTQAKNDIPSWNFATSSIGALATSLVIGSIMSGGISLLILSLHTLFGIDVSYKCYLYILTLCNVCLALFLFLGLLPQGKEKHNDRPLPNAFLNSIIHYLFLPLEIGYMIVLYIYAGSILANWELPIGWVSWLVTIMMGGCIIIEFGLYPARMEKEKRTDRLIARWLPILALPLLILMTVSIGRRLQDYGITINRLYLLTFNLWCYLVCIGLLTNRARRISWIPISFACIFLLVSILPVNYASITRNKIHKDIETSLKQATTHPLPLSKDIYETCLKEMPHAQAANLNDRIRYMRDWFGWESLQDLVASNVSLYTLPETEPESHSYRGQTSSPVSVNIPQGYNKLTAIEQQFSGTDNALPETWWKNGTLPVLIEGTNDTLYFDLSILKGLNQYETEPMPPTVLRCSSPEKSFILTRFSLNYSEQEPEDTYLSFNGYLFTK